MTTLKHPIFCSCRSNHICDCITCSKSLCYLVHACSRQHVLIQHARRSTSNPSSDKGDNLSLLMRSILHSALLSWVSTCLHICCMTALRCLTCQLWPACEWVLCCGRYETCAGENCYFTLRSLLILCPSYLIFMIANGGLALPGGLFMPSIMVRLCFQQLGVSCRRRGRWACPCVRCVASTL